MRLYLAGAECVGTSDTLGGLGGLANLHLLTSYHTIQNGNGWALLKQIEQRRIPAFLDSGAFSALTLGVRIDLEQYIAFCQAEGWRFEVIASLDAIMDARLSIANHKHMRRAGINCVPTFHVRESFDVLEELLRENDYIALGVAGMQRRRHAVLRWLTQCFRLRQQINPACRFHGFALTSSEIMSLFPWYSVDSSTWLVGRKFCEVIVRDGYRFRRVRREEFPRATRRYHIPSDILPERSTSNECYFPIDRWNASVMLDWAQRVDAKQVQDEANRA